MLRLAWLACPQVMQLLAWLACQVMLRLAWLVLLRGKQACRV